ncbi:arf-GAP with dual PH domain-containing protein 1-like isoform X1 [Sitodiplosis mosellana]|uniref:arf-GAP with dual PH domain-containing protein 1-like isoform X1 n=2 Tax=Sitodiplosis mosellana TaxID=263140 RepID=UPI002444BED5|nr:arf-GAP with dual PH domain-containing protein 1-like isoform X1 [Sitodiplosis mosellana]XP_055312159.1 arf-GAP with dual PH domain-containing protein 1-like isoform X1 [Sitodiplosis mosellana]XP_055312160.1 arf-GAP with dual PH domain-containing protein 1-like isoform X1 [Sitodiplosis mosellana]XP_055312161.1 arf-GAP with dual PH domain-containing protein 1-like isoform X1 [Sitodiplosis mosellana]XP_055312162.1 arf-GAP with dual PH domain-containing protein 1-like isoform X1 [Sitodiplosis m
MLLIKQRNHFNLYPFEMADENEKLLMELMRKNENSICADCRRKDVEWASYNIGIFLCTQCASVHRSIGAHISKVKHLKMDRWEDSEVERMKEVGNYKARLKYEQRVPACYRRPTEHTPQVLLEQYIRAKYERLEFCHIERPSYTSGYMDGFLMKKGKEDHRYQMRKFILSESDDTLKYYVKESKEPKAVLRLSELNVAFAPAKIEHKSSMQLTFLKDGSTRHIYLYHDDPEVIVNWYMAIRCAKLHRLQVAFPSATESDLIGLLSHDFAKEGWIFKTGPRQSDGYKRRWFTLDNRKLMYHDDRLDAYPKGEIFLGNHLDGYSVRIGVSTTSAKNQGYPFTLFTPERIYNLSCATEQERDEWIRTIQHVLERPLTPQDSSVSARLIRKRTGTNSINIFTGR